MIPITIRSTIITIIYVILFVIHDLLWDYSQEALPFLDLPTAIGGIGLVGLGKWDLSRATRCTDSKACSLSKIKSREAVRAILFRRIGMHLVSLLSVGRTC